jgi:type IV fimbrial biogenesis protein FimT
MAFRAFTVIELIAALAIASILLFMALPAFNDLTERFQTTSRVNAIVGIVRFARETAVTQGRMITLCPAGDAVCTGASAWHTGIMAFADLNRDGARQPGEPIAGYMPALKAGETLLWRSFRNKNYLQFRSAGYTNWQNGSFHYCPASRDPANGKVIIVNIQGRAVPSVDTDGDGIDEQANGDPLRC